MHYCDTYVALGIPEVDIDASWFFAQNHLMNGAPQSSGQASAPSVTRRKFDWRTVLATIRALDWRTVLATIGAAVVLLGFALLLARLSAFCPTAGSYLLVCGVVFKGVASLLEAIMKTEDEGFWRPGPKRASAWLNVLAVVFAFPPLFAKAVEADLVTFQGP